MAKIKVEKSKIEKQSAEIIRTNKVALLFLLLLALFAIWYLVRDTFRQLPSFSLIEENFVRVIASFVAIFLLIYIVFLTLEYLVNRLKRAIRNSSKKPQAQSKAKRKT